MARGDSARGPRWAGRQVRSAGAGRDSADERQVIEGKDQLRRMLRETPAGRTITLMISRDGQQHDDYDADWRIARGGAAGLGAAYAGSSKPACVLLRRQMRAGRANVPPTGERILFEFNERGHMPLSEC